MIQDPRTCTVMNRGTHDFCGRPGAVKYLIKKGRGNRVYDEPFPLYRCEEHKDLHPKYLDFDGPVPVDAETSSGSTTSG